MYHPRLNSDTHKNLLKVFYFSFYFDKGLNRPGQKMMWYICHPQPGKTKTGNYVFICMYIYNGQIRWTSNICIYVCVCINPSQSIYPSIHLSIHLLEVHCMCSCLSLIEIKFCSFLQVILKKTNCSAPPNIILHITYIYIH